jgi:hypothetical protein
MARFAKPAPSPRADKAEHKRHAEEFLQNEDHRDPRRVNKPEYRDTTDVVQDRDA